VGEARRLTDHPTTVDAWQWGQKSDRIYFTAPDRDNEIDRKRKEKKFDVQIREEITIPEHIWEVTVDGEERQLTTGTEFTDGRFDLSKDGRWMLIRRSPFKRYLSRNDADIYLMNLQTSNVERLTDNKVSEGGIGFSPDSRYIYYTKRDKDKYLNNEKLHIRPVEGGEWKMLLPDEDISIRRAFWGEDGKTVFIGVGEGVRENIFKFDINGSGLERVTDLDGVVRVTYLEKNNKLMINYSDPKTPSDYYIADPSGLGNRGRWVRLTDSDPEVRQFELADCETVRWKSRDGTMVEGLLYTPPDLDPNRRYPLIVQVHGGPASASMRSFNTSYGNYVHIFTANGYIILQPNYRGSSNYGEKFRTEIARNYFQKGFEDIMAGVDYLIKRGIAHPDSLGHMGWSAGGHWSNWALVKTDRFKAISSGAGGMNWISMYAQTDMQEPREFYFGGLPYNNWDGFWDVSPLKFIKNAKTPTLIHCGEDDQRVPRPQSEELHMALMKLGVPTEFIVYPNMPHGLTEIRYQLVKMVSEFYWFEKWIRGREEWFDWQELLDTLEKEGKK